MVSAADDGTAEGHQRVSVLMGIFGFKRHLVYTVEHAVRFGILGKCPEFHDQLRVVYDDDVRAVQDGVKCLGAFRPDMYGVDDTTNIALHIEIDERDDHECCDKRLRAIDERAGVRGTYVVRVRCRMGTPGALCVTKHNRAGRAFNELSGVGKDVIDEIADYVRTCMEWMRQGTLPTESTRVRVF